jgi:hypothetical protein
MMAILPDQGAEYIKPRWIQIMTDVVRPGGVLMMFFIISVLPLIFSILEIGIKGVGTQLAGVMAGYYDAIPDIFYTTLQVMFVGYVAGKSTEVVSSNLSKKRDINIPSENTTVKVQPDIPPEPERPVG